MPGSVSANVKWISADINPLSLTLTLKVSYGYGNFTIDRGATIQIFTIRYVSRYNGHDTIHDTIHIPIFPSLPIILPDCFIQTALVIEWTRAFVWGR